MIDWLQKQCTVAQAMEIKEIKKLDSKPCKFSSKNIQSFFIKYENYQNCVPHIFYQLSQMFMEFFFKQGLVA